MGGVEGWGMGCGMRIATASVRTGFAMTGFFTRGAEGRATARVAPTEGYKGCGRPRGSPLRRVTRGAGGRATARVAPTEGHVSISYTYIIKQYFFAMSRKFFAAEVNLRQRRGIFRWDREGCGPEKSPPCGRCRCKGASSIRALFYADRLRCFLLFAPNRYRAAG